MNIAGLIIPFISSLIIKIVCLNKIIDRNKQIRYDNFLQRKNQQVILLKLIQIFVSFYQIYSNQSMSGNRNMADYTNFDGKTNKKIVHAPGGACSINLGWSNEPTDYGPERNIRKASRQKQSEYTPKQPQRHLYSQPMKVMNQPPISYGSKNVGMGNQYYENRMGGERGYDNYNNIPHMNQPMMGGGGYGQSDPRQGYGNYAPKMDQIDIAVQEHKILKHQRPPSVPRQESNQTQGKSSIRIVGPQRENNIFGDANYNYWKDDQSGENTKKQNGSEQRIQQQIYSQKNIGSNEKTSVRVNNPPGGKQNFKFG